MMEKSRIQKSTSIFAISNTSDKIRFNNQFYNIIELNLQKDMAMAKGYGFTISGYCPCHVENISEESTANKFGLQESDLIMKINNINCQRATLKTVTNLIKNSPNEMRLVVYRQSHPKCLKNTSKLTIKPTIKKVKKTSYLGKLFRPWFSCSAAPLNNNISSMDNTLDKTCYMKSATSFNKEQNSQFSTQTSSQNIADTGYETLSSAHDDSNDYTIETVTNTMNSYSDYDLTTSHLSVKEDFNKVCSNERFNETKTQLIGDLIEMEANFVSYLSTAVAQLTRPLRGFFMQQQDYFVLFQNIEKILIISENFLRSMDKWSALDLYTRIGQLYTQKLNLFREAFTTFTKGHGKSKCLLTELKSHSKQFRLFLNETQSENMTLNNLIDLPLIHINETLNYFKQIRRFTIESKRNPSEAPHIDSVILELRIILANTPVNVDNLEQEYFACNDQDDIDFISETSYSQDDELTMNSFFMSTTINDVTLTALDTVGSNYIGSKRSLVTSSDESDCDL